MYLFTLYFFKHSLKFCSAEEFATIFNTLSIFFELATDEPPNFNTFILKKFENFILNYFDTIEI